MIRVKEHFSRYEVTEDGRIFDKKYQRPSSTFKSNKYIQCRLVDDEGSIHIMGLHVAVAMYHDPDYKPGCLVHHKDGNTHNNQVSNLECMSRSKHSSLHADPNNLRRFIYTKGPWNKGKEMSEEFRRKCRDSAKRKRKK